MIAANTIDDFVRTVLETKAALISAVVDGRAMAPELSGDVLDELQRAIRAISSELSDTPQNSGSEDLIDRLLQRARLDLEADRTREVGVRVRTPDETAALKLALVTRQGLFPDPPSSATGSLAPLTPESSTS
jgi:hypothetical protein